MKTAAMFLILVAATATLSAQFKSQIENEGRVSDGLLNQSAPSLLFGWFDPSKFQMHHSIDFTYTTMGGQGMSLGTYTNSMLYQFSDKLDARADLSLSYSPTNSFSTFGKKNDLSSVYLSRAQVSYRPWENVSLMVQYRALPYNPYYSPFAYPLFRENGF